MRLKLGKVDLNDLIVLGALVGVEAEVGILVGARSREILQGVDVLDCLGAARGFEVSSGGLRVGEDRGSGANLSTVR